VSRAFQTAIRKYFFINIFWVMMLESYNTVSINYHAEIADLHVFCAQRKMENNTANEIKIRRWSSQWRQDRSVIQSRRDRCNQGNYIKCSNCCTIYCLAMSYSIIKIGYGISDEFWINECSFMNNLLTKFL